MNKELLDKIGPIDVLERIKDIAIDTEIGWMDYFKYEWNQGSERLEHHFNEAGSVGFSGIHHPNKGMCETDAFNGVGQDGLCFWCGRTLW